MKLRVTIDIFSGRPNPVIEIEDAAATKIMDLLSNASKMKKITNKTVQAPGNLGYRGMIIEQIGRASGGLPATMQVTHQHLFTNDSYSEIAGDALEELVLGKLGRFTGTGDKTEFRQYLEKEMKRFRNKYEEISRIPSVLWPPLIGKACFCAPDPDLAWWNDGATIQGNNNCYNYASNYRSDTYAQPGKAAGQQYTSLSSCSVAAGSRSAKDGAIADQLVDLPDADNKCPKKGHLVALVIAPNSDFHWFRKGPNGRWSHKPGSTAARITDNANNLITDPRTADRGPYTQFCTFMQVIHGHIKIA